MQCGNYLYIFGGASRSGVHMNDMVILDAGRGMQLVLQFVVIKDMNIINPFGCCPQVIYLFPSGYDNKIMGINRILPLLLDTHVL